MDGSPTHVQDFRNTSCKIKWIYLRVGTSPAVMNRVKQMNMFQKSKLSFGGSLLKKGTNPKRARPLDSKLPIHLVLRSAEGRMRLPKFFARVDEIVDQVATKRGVRIYQYANCGNHLHVLLKLTRRTSWNAFIRELTGRLARLTKASWAHRPFTRVVSGWRKAFETVKAYVRLNAVEAHHGLTREEIREMEDVMRRLHHEAS